MRIVAISDISWKNTTLLKLKKLLDKVHPDLILFAGDLVDDKFGL